MKQSVLAFAEQNGGSEDVKKCAWKLLNDTMKRRLLSKQEACCQLAGLSLVTCSETVEDVSLSGSVRIGTENAGKTTFLNQYATRKDNYELSLTEYFHYIKNRNYNPRKARDKNNQYGFIHQGNKKLIIPNFTSGRSDPEYPPSESYARSTILRYMPWRTEFMSLTNNGELSWVDLFESFLENPKCPLPVRIGFNRAKHRLLSKTPEITNKEELIDYSQFCVEASTDVIDLVNICTTVAAKFNDADEYDGLFEYGYSYDWSKRHFQVSKI